MSILNKYRDLVNQKKLKFFALDGLDGSGKGTLINLLAKQLSGRYGVLVVEFPIYTTEFGKILTHLLKINDENLSLEERMCVYALNRLESVDCILKQVVELSNECENIFVLFDRFVTSNILTISYYLAKSMERRNVDASSIIEESDLDKHFFAMLEMDQDFIDILLLRSTKIVVPRIDPKTALERIQSDETREGSDSYEKTTVQIIADDLYTKLLKKNMFDFSFVEQNQKAPEEIIERILKIHSGFFDLDRSDSSNPVRKLDTTSCNTLEFSLNYIKSKLKRYKNINDLFVRLNQYEDLSRFA